MYNAVSHASTERIRISIRNGKLTAELRRCFTQRSPEQSGNAGSSAQSVV